MAKYINPYTDFGFKKLFGEEVNKDLLIDFLNQLLPEYHQIADLNFRNPENLPDITTERKAFFDIHCQAISGERFIVEMQKEEIKHFKDRSLFYTTFPIREQAQKGRWNFQLEAIYFVAILDFEYDEEEEKRKFRRDVALKDQDGDVFFDKLHFKFLQMPLFNLKENELKTKFDKWCYFLKNLDSFEHIPSILNEPIFQKAFSAAELARLSPEQRAAYDEDLMQYWTITSVIETAIEKAVETALEQREVEIAKKLIKRNLTNEEIAEDTGLNPKQIEAIRAEINKNGY